MTQIRAAQIRATQIKATQIKATQVRETDISSNHRELRGAILNFIRENCWAMSLLGRAPGGCAPQARFGLLSHLPLPLCFPPLPPPFSGGHSKIVFISPFSSSLLLFLSFFLSFLSLSSLELCFLSFRKRIFSRLSERNPQLSLFSSGRVS